MSLSKQCSSGVKGFVIVPSKTRVGKHSRSVAEKMLTGMVNGM